MLLLLLAACFVIDLTRTARSPIPADEKADATAEPSTWAVFGGVLAGLILAAPLAYVAGYPLESALDQGALPVVWLLGIPLLAATWWALWRWIERGRLLLPTLILPIVVLLVNLLAAGSIAFPGVIATLLVMGPAALCLAGHGGGASAAGVWSGWDFALTRPAVVAAAVSAMCLTALCVLTEYHPVLISRAALEAGMAEWNVGHKEAAMNHIEQAIAADPRSPQLWRVLAEMRLDRWLTTSDEADWRSFQAAADGLVRHDPQHHLAYATRGGWLLTAWRKNGRAELLTQAAEEYRQAISCYPNRALYHAQLAWTLHLAGRDEEARAEAERARQLDDLTPHRDQKLAVQKIVDPQFSAGGLTKQRSETAEQLVEQLRTKGGTSGPKDKTP
jgi:tetratricopeptide (TPR) repeat protein